MRFNRRTLTQGRLRFRSLFLRKRVEAELDAELENHFAFQLEQGRAAGLPEHEAYQKTLQSIEGLDLIKERCRDMRRLNAFEDFYHDVRYALRSFRHSPGFAIATVTILALGIGATTAVFSAVDRLLFKGMPYASPKSLVSLGFTLPFMDQEFLFGSTYLEWQHHAHPFESLGAWTDVAGCDLTEANPARMNCALVDSHFLTTLGVTLELGRNFSSDEDRPNGAKVAVISDAMWRGRFGSDPHTIGKLISVDGSSTRVVGVLPGGFELPNMSGVDLLLPLTLDLTIAGPGMPLRIVGRLKPALGSAGATLQLQSLAKQFRESAPPPLRSQIHFILRSLADYQEGNLRRTSFVLFASVLLILLIACANVANLLLARAVSRQREVAVRTALGAGRKRLIRQMLAESLLLSTLGGCLGCGLASLLLFCFKLLGPSALPRLTQTSVNTRMLLFAGCLSLFNGLVFGLAPALMSVRGETLAGRKSRSTTSTYFAHILTSSQVALSLVLLMLSAVFLQSLWRLSHVSLGLDAKNVVLVQLALNSSRYSRTPAKDKFLADLQTRVRKLPGVTAAAFSDTVPPGGFVHTRPMRILQVPGADPIRDIGQIVAWRTVSPEYFRALGIPILRGRTFKDRDQWGKESSVVLSRSLSRQLFGTGNSVGKTINLVTDQVSALTVVGVADDVKNNGPALSSTPEYYVVQKLNHPDGDVQNSLAARTVHASSAAVVLIVRASGRPDALAAWIHSAVAEIDSTVPVQISTLQSTIDRLSERPRFEAALLSFFASVALFLAAVGIYGLVSFLVVQRIPEIGVRMALGASPYMILTFVLKHTLQWIGTGVCVGAVFTIFAVRSVRSLLFDPSVASPTLFFAVAFTLVATGLVAALFPSRRAAAIDPLVALRQE